MTITRNHVALLVRSVRDTGRKLAELGFHIGPAENWEGEGTLEIYVERERGNSLLLMEPTKSGAYKNALDKRGPGLHHLAIDVLQLDPYLSSLAGSGWLLHPTSFQTIQKSRTVYLARPGFPALIEVQERPQLDNKPEFVTGLELPFTPDLTRLLPYVGLKETVRPSAEAALQLGTFRVTLENLL